jgi:uroporphyrin-III C-methyltransferase
MIEDKTKQNIRSGVLLVGHGSRRFEANEDVREAARRIAERGGFSLVEAAFLEIEHPTIVEGFKKLVEQGAKDITILPYFLMPGRHTRGDLPVDVREAANQHPDITYRIAEPLAGHHLIIESCVERIREAQGKESKRILEGNGIGGVYLVGAGPGDPGLLTIKARDLLSSCDVVVYDYLVNPEILQHVNKEAERFYVGKVGGGSYTPQEEINELLIKLAKAGKQVVRLKGGDPFLFGRGAEEAESLQEAGIKFEVVPGVSSVTAVPAYAGIPITHRSLASSVAIVTGSRVKNQSYLQSLKALAAADTIVILMGVAKLREISETLISSGRSIETPAIVIRWGTYKEQQAVTGTLGTIADEVERTGLGTPALIVVGEVVALRDQLKWFEENFGNNIEEKMEEYSINS